MNIHDILNYVDNMTEKDTFDIARINLLKSAHPNLNNSDRKELKRHIQMNQRVLFSIQLFLLFQ